jgi:chromate transporter
VLGVCGSLTATLALILPSFIIMLLIVRFYLKFKNSKLYEGTMGWLKPCVVGLIGAAAIILIIKTTWMGGMPNIQVVSENFPDWKSWLLLGGAFVASYWGKVNPIYVILAGAVLGLLLY